MLPDPGLTLEVLDEAHGLHKLKHLVGDLHRLSDDVFLAELARAVADYLLGPS